MMIRASGTIEAKSWNEEPFSEAGTKLCRVIATNRFSGDIEGDATLGYLLAYLDEKSGSAIGFEQVTGSVGGRSGGFVLEHHGTFTGEGVEIDLRIVEGSGTDGLRGVSGSGRFAATYDGKPSPYTLDIEVV
jgi:hypothetical protein